MLEQKLRARREKEKGEKGHYTERKEVLWERRNNT